MPGQVVHPDEPLLHLALGRLCAREELWGKARGYLTWEEMNESLPDEAVSLDKLEEMQGRRIGVVHIIGGGLQNELLCQFAADAMQRPVVTGPVEATAMGNILMQALALGEIASLDEGRELVRNSCEVKTYEPGPAAPWTWARPPWWWSSTSPGAWRATPATTPSSEASSGTSASSPTASTAAPAPGCRIWPATT